MERDNHMRFLPVCCCICKQLYHSNNHCNIFQPYDQAHAKRKRLEHPISENTGDSGMCCSIRAPHNISAFMQHRTSTPHCFMDGLMSPFGEPRKAQIIGNPLCSRALLCCRAFEKDNTNCFRCMTFIFPFHVQTMNY